MTDQIVFPPHKGLPYDWAPPTINGFCEWELGLQTSEIEAGWDGSARLTFGGASRLPVVSFQGVRHASDSFLYLSFLIRFDWHYDTDDGIILVFQDHFSTAAHPAGTRRLVIRPNHNGVGAGTSPTPDFSPSYTDPVTMITQTVPVRTDKDVNYDFASWDSVTSTWVHAPITAATGGPFEIKTRSWDFDSKDLCWSVEIKIPTTKAKAGAFASNWIDLDPTGFGFYFNVLKMVPDPGYTGPGTPDPLIGNMVTEYFWPATYVSGATTKANSITDDDGNFTSYESIPINPERMGKGLLTGAGTGVAFDYTAGSPIFINVKDSLGGIVTAGTIFDISGTNTNEIIAKLKNNGAPADDVRATFHIARFGITGVHQADWLSFSPDPATTLKTPNINPTAFIPTLGASGQLTVNWRLTGAESNTFQGLETDNCIAVYLDSDKGTVFTESATWQNMTLKNLSSSRTKLHVNGKNQGPTHDGGKDHDYLITVVKRLVLSTNDYDGWTAPKGTAPGKNWAGNPFDPNRDHGEDGPQGNGNEKNPKLGRTTPTIGRVVFDRWTKATQPSATWVVITVGYVRTPKKLTLGGKTYTLYNLVDTCSQVLTHEGPVERFDHRVTGPGLHRLDDGVYRIPVPSDGEVVLEASSEAIEKGQEDILDRILVLIDKLTSLIDRLGGCAERIDPLQALLKKLARAIKLLPLPASVRDTLAQTLSRIGAVQQSLRVLPALRALLEAVEHHVEVLDRILDQIQAVDPKKLDAQLERIFGGDAARVRKIIVDFEGRLNELGGLVQLLERAVDLLEKVSRLCHDIDGLYALLRGLGRALEKVRVFGEGLEERFPVIEKLLPKADPQSGTIGATIAQIIKNGAQFDELFRLLESVGELEKALEREHERIEAIPYEEIAKIAEKLYKAAGH